MTDTLYASLQFVAIVVASVLAAVIYGVVHDQVTARICIEYFTIGHPPVFTAAVTSPTIIGLTWGVIATWWVGLGLGIPLAMAATLGHWPRRNVASLIGPLTKVMLVTGMFAVASGAIGYLAASSGWVFLIEPMASRVPADRHVGFITDLWAHSASYLFGALGGILLIIHTWRSRRLLPQAAVKAAVEPSPTPAIRTPD